MDLSLEAERLNESGRYKEALQALSDPRHDRRGQELLRAELFEAVGETERARHFAEEALKSRGLSDSDRSRAEFVLSRVESELGNFDAELIHLRKSISCAERANDLKRICWAQLRLVALIADSSGPESVSALMTAIRGNVTKLGDQTMTAALHLFVAQLDGKRGLLASALHHTTLSQRILATSSHLGLESWAHNNLLALSILNSDLEQAISYGAVALSVSLECGSMASLRRCLGNLGRLYFTKGDFEKALNYLDQALNHSSFNNEQVHSFLETIARIYLTQGKLSECLSVLNRIETSTQHPNGTGRYVHRYSMMTKAELLLQMNMQPESMQCIEQVLLMAKQADDQWLTGAAEIVRAEIQLRQPGMSADWHPPVGSTLIGGDWAPDLFAMQERLAANALAGRGEYSLAKHHFERANRIYRSLKNAPGIVELERSWQQAATQQDVNGARDTGTVRSASIVLQDIAALLAHARKPELVATGLVAILKDIESVTGAVAVARSDSGREDVLASFGSLPAGASIRTLQIGTSGQRTVEVRLLPRPDIESHAALNSITLLLATIRDLEKARTEREKHLTLWPAEELLADDDTAVVLGQMQNLMSLARKVAQTNISVLITGESGTGKEVLARAIHGLSLRAKKPFIPFNCTAIPRELLESQLFGYRRGAFTGADRDSLGLIRAAKDGTLFLDEVGELSPELQPKLLRFLESGEINPLGDTSPFTVNVRIVAATNTNLEALVQEGRFREDLFYRLNVVRLVIPPLRERRDEIPALAHHFIARACKEFSKSGMRLAEETMEQLILYPWPGNIRQLQNELRRMVALADNETVLTSSTLSRPIRQEIQQMAHSQPSVEFPVPVTEKLGPALSRIEREMIKTALRANQGRLEATAKALGISRKGLYLKRQRLGV
jgi:DNA-binding NtrC family response regulator